MAAWQAAPVRVSAAPLPLVASAPAPVNAPAPGRATEGAATRAHPFAELLRQSRDEGAAPVAPHERTLPIPRDQEVSASGETSEPASTPTSPTKARPRAAAPAASTAAKLASAAPPADEAAEPVRGEKDASASSDVDGAAGHAASGDARADGWLAQALAAEHPLAPTTERADGERSRAAANVDAEAAADANAKSQTDLVATNSGTQAGRADARGSVRVDANDGRVAARAAVGDVDADPRASTPTLAAPFTEATRASETGAHRPGTEARIDALAPALAAGAASPTGAAPAAAAPTELTLATPIDSADFGAAFGVQVSVLAKDGVQQAELHLNPAETGPVSIRIALDGSEARIDFGVDLAATRAAIERSLPELAAALSDAGLTLTGGGVSQHAGGRAPSGDADGSPSRRAGTRSHAADGVAPALPGTRRVAAGGVDLYA
jgi:flagellar hook-length control protein FliK